MTVGEYRQELSAWERSRAATAKITGRRCYRCERPLSLQLAQLSTDYADELIAVGMEGEGMDADVAEALTDVNCRGDDDQFVDGIRVICPTCIVDAVTPVDIALASTTADVFRCG